jgi:hypothetical protein
MEEITFKPAGLNKQLDLSTRFREDFFVANVHSQQRICEELGKSGEKNTHWLKRFLCHNPQGVIHIRQADNIIGQQELSMLPDIPERGYSNLFYLIPSTRGSDHVHQLNVSWN